MNLSSKEVMDLTRARTYVRTSSQNPLDKTRDFSEDLWSEGRNQVESDMIQKDAGIRTPSSTARRSQQSNLNSPFASRSTEVRMEFNSWLNSSQFAIDGIEDDDQVEDYVDDFEDTPLSYQSETQLPTINASGDRNGTTSDLIDKIYSSVSVLGHDHLENEDKFSLLDPTETSGVPSKDLIRSEDPPQTNHLRAIRQLSLVKAPVGKQEQDPALIYHQYRLSQRTIENNQTDTNYPSEDVASNLRTSQGSTKAQPRSSQESEDTYTFNDEHARAAGYNNEKHYRLQREHTLYQNSEVDPRENEPQGSSLSRSPNKASSVTGLAKIMRKEELESSELSYNQVPANTSRTTGEVKFSRSMSQGGPLSILSRESYSQRPRSSQGNGSSFSLSRDLEHEYLEETRNKSSLSSNAGTNDRGSRRGKDSTRSLADDVTVPTSSSEAFQLFAKTRLIGLAKQEDLLTASVTQRRIRNQNDPNKMVDDEIQLRRINYFGLAPIVDPPQDEPLVEILALKSIQLHACDMIVTSETYSEHQRLCDRTQLSGTHTIAFSILFQRIGKVLSLLENDIASCTNQHRATLFNYLDDILERYNQFGVQVVSYLPDDWESWSLKIHKYYLILIKERYLFEASNYLRDLNCCHETEMVSLLESAELLQSQNPFEMEKDLDQDDNNSISSEAAFDVYAELLNSKSPSKYSVKSQTQYDPRLNITAKGFSKSPIHLNKPVSTPERVYNEHKDHGSPSSRGVSSLGLENNKKDGVPTTIELINPLKYNYNLGDLDDPDENGSRASTTHGRNFLPSRDKPSTIFTKDMLYATRDAQVLALQNKIGFSEHQRDAMLPGGIGSSTLNNLGWTHKMSQYRNYQYCVNLIYLPGTDKIDFERFLSDSAMRARQLELSTKELCLIFKETGMGPSKETSQSLTWNTKYPTIVNRVLSKANWELGTDTGEEWLYWEILWNKIRIEIVTLGIAKKNDNTLADRLESVYFTRHINLESPNDIENLDKLTTWVDKLTTIYRTSNQSKMNYSYLWFFILRKLVAVNCPYIMVWTKYLKSQMNKAMTMMNLTPHDRQKLFGTTEGFEREEDNLQKDDFEWAFDCLRTSHVNNHLDYSIAIVCIKTANLSRARSTVPPPPLAQPNRQRKVNSTTSKSDFSFDMFGGQEGKSFNQVERNLRQESYLMTNSIPILSMLKDKTPEQIAKAAKFKEFLTKHNLSICSCGLLKDTSQCNDKCDIITNNEFKIGPFVQFLKNKSQRLGHKLEDKEVLQLLQYVQRNNKWDDTKLKAYHKSVMEKWTPINLSTAAVAKVLNVLSNLGASSHQTSNEGEEDDVSYGETDSSHF